MRAAGSLCLAVLVGISSVAGESSPNNAKKKSAEVFKNLKVLNNIPADLLLPSMQFITSSLGVSCEYCHVENAFDRDDKKPKKTARQMMVMVNELNSKFQGKLEITCYSCHRGSPRPLTVPVIAAATPRLLSEPLPDVHQASANDPSPVDVIAKYINARGGAGRIASLVSLEERGTFASDSHAFPIEVYETKSARSATLIHFPGADRIAVFDGASGSVLVPGRQPRAMTPGEADAARMDVDLQFAPDLNKIFSEIKFTGTSNLGTQGTVVLSGQRPGLPAVEMYFDVTSGLLLRTIHYSPSALGLNPTETDYSDYRETGGVKIPFRWTSATPTGRFTVQIESAHANGDIPEKVFSIPTGP